MSEPSVTDFRYCPACGAERRAGAAFCERCGFKIASLRASDPRLTIVVAAVAVTVVVGAFAWLAPSADDAHPPVAGATGPAPAMAPPAPGMADAAAPAGLPQVTREQIEERLKPLRDAVASAPEDVDAQRELALWLYRGSVFQPTYRDEARAAFDRVLELAPGDLDAILGIGNLAYDAEQFDVAIEQYRKYLAERPEDANVRTDLATMLLYKGDPDGAIAEYRKVLEEHPDFVNAQFNLGHALRLKGDLDGARAAYAKVLEMSPTPELTQRVNEVMAALAGGEGGAALPPGHPPLATADGAGAAAGGAPAAGAQAATLQADVEQMLRGNPILGPKVVDVSWDTPTLGKAYVAGFPMDQMPPEMRQLFQTRMTGRLEEIRGRHGQDAKVRVELVDQATGAVMGSIEG